jgi:hypothetical protein
VRKKRVILCLIGAALALIALLAYNPTSGEPSYEGHPLSYWVAILGSSPPRSDEEKAKNAIDHIGAAALPFLVKWIQYNPPRWKRTVAYTLARTPLPLAHKLANRMIGPRLVIGTHFAFAALGPRAMPAFDDLRHLMNDTNRPNTTTEAARALSCFGTNALPALLAVITNTNHPARVGALSAIAEMSHLPDAAQTAVPVIINCLTDTNPTVQIVAIVTLGRLKASPQVSVPALVSCLKTKYETIRFCSAAALGQFGPQATSAIPALTNALTDADRRVRASAAKALHEIDPVTFPRSVVQ